MMLEISLKRSTRSATSRAVLDVLQHGLAGVELRLLRQVADGDVFAGPGFAGEIGVDPAHDLHERGLARAVGADDADLGALVELQVDVVEHRLLRAGEGFRHVLHDVGVLGGHRGSLRETERLNVRNWSALYRAQGGKARAVQRGGQDDGAGRCDTAENMLATRVLSGQCRSSG
jgi:hypothetical protein